NVDDAAELAAAHAFDHRAAHVEQRIQVRIDHRTPLLRGHAVKHGIAGDAGVVDQHLDGTEVGLDLLEPGGAGPAGADIPLVDRIAGAGLDLRRRRVIAAVVRRDIIARGLEGLRYRFADSA